MQMLSWFLLIGFMKLCQSQLYLQSLWAKEKPDTMPKLVNLQVVCAKDHMRIFVEFDSAFNGVVFSKGKYVQDSCVYIHRNSGVTHANFDIYYNKCGTKPDFQSKYYENIIIIQYGADVIEAWDEAKRLRCEWARDFDKSASQTGIRIQDIEVIELEFQGDNIDCWMEIQEGKGPWARHVSGIVPIGSPLTMVIAINDQQGQFDMKVKSCWANDGKKKPIQLTDDYGCVLRPKMLTPFLKVRDYNGKASIISYSYFYAFKFPDTMDVYVQCKVEICRHSCKDSCPNQLPIPVPKDLISQTEDVAYIEIDPQLYPKKTENLHLQHSKEHTQHIPIQENVKSPQEHKDRYIVYTDQNNQKLPQVIQPVYIVPHIIPLKSNLENDQKQSSDSSQSNPSVDQNHHLTDQLPITPKPLYFVQSHVADKNFQSPQPDQPMSTDQVHSHTLAVPYAVNIDHSINPPSVYIKQNHPRNPASQFKLETAGSSLNPTAISFKPPRSGYPYPVPQFMPRNPTYGMMQISDRIDEDIQEELGVKEFHGIPRSLRTRRTINNEFGVYQSYQAVSSADLDFEYNSTKDETPVYEGRSEDIVYGVCLSVTSFVACLGLLLVLILCSTIVSFIMYFQFRRRQVKTDIGAKLWNGSWFVFYRNQ